MLTPAPSAAGPTVDADGVTFALADPGERFAAVHLDEQVGLGRPPFGFDDGMWTLQVARPPVDRIEYRLVLTDRQGRDATITDPANPQRVATGFGDRSVVQFPGYAAPAWLTAPAARGRGGGLFITEPGGGPVHANFFEPRSLRRDEPAPLLVAHDGPDYDTLGHLVHYIAASIEAGRIAPTRVLLLAPGDRNRSYAANPDYARLLVERVLADVPATSRTGLGVSLGALAMLHAHRSRRATFDALFLQSGSFFTPDLDPQESGFTGFAAVTDFVASVHDADRDERPIPVALTCGTVEENLANNRLMATTLARLGYDVALTEVRDTHNFTAWRDALHPHLTDLLRGLDAP